MSAMTDSSPLTAPLTVRDPEPDSEQTPEIVFDVRNLNVAYGSKLALKDVTLQIPRNRVTAFIGPSGCGKSTFIRCFNRMNDLIPSARVDGTILYHGQDMYAETIDPVE